RVSGVTLAALTATPGFGLPCAFVGVTRKRLSATVRAGGGLIAEAPRASRGIQVSETTATGRRVSTGGGTTRLAVIGACSCCHMLNDMMQSLLPAIYPMLKTSLNLDFGQIGLVTLAFQLTASLLQPAVGAYTDARPQPFSLAVGMGFSLIG